jgi:TetR/AcrR family transcriptional regulator, transcriptional repressor of aconitase
MTRVTPEHTDARLRSIEQAAFRVFARKGSEKATMAEIAREAGLSAGALYLYYSSKAELLRAVCVDKSTDIRDVFEAAASEGSSPLNTLERVGQMFAEMFESEGYEDHVIVGFEAAIAAAREPEQFGNELCEDAEALTGALRSLIYAAQDAGEIDPDIDARQLAVVLHAVGLGLRELRLIHRGTLDAAGAFDMVTTMLRRMGPAEAMGGNSGIVGNDSRGSTD